VPQDTAGRGTSTRHQTSKERKTQSDERSKPSLFTTNLVLSFRLPTCSGICCRTAWHLTFQPRASAPPPHKKLGRRTEAIQCSPAREFALLFWLWGHALLLPRGRKDPSLRRRMRSRLVVLAQLHSETSCALCRHRPRPADALALLSCYYIFISPDHGSSSVKYSKHNIQRNKQTAKEKLNYTFT